MTRPYRDSRASRYPDFGPLRELVADDRAWVALGTVWQPLNASSHYRVLKDGDVVNEVLVEVLTVPAKRDLTCQLGTVAGGPGRGVWAVPAVGTMVVVVIPDGRVDFAPAIVATLPSGGPGRFDEDKLVIVASGTIEITAPKIVLSSDPTAVVDATDGLVHGRGIDPFSRATYAALGNTSSVVKAEK